MCRAGLQNMGGSARQEFLPTSGRRPGLRGFARLSAQEYFHEAGQAEEKNFAEELAPGRGQSDAVVRRLKSSLAGFYQVGSQLYGMNLHPENLAIAPTEDINAFATGSHVFMNAGLMQYFLRPADYVAGMIRAQTGELTSEQYQAIQNTCDWQNDWESIYFVLAHEASHNLMRHRDAMVFSPMRTMFEPI
jgi:hypothetical protein